MKRYQVNMSCNNRQEMFVVEKLTFAEAAQEAYKAKNKKGFSWHIDSIRLIHEASHFRRGEFYLNV